MVSGKVKPDEFIVDKRVINSQLDPTIKIQKGNKSSKIVYGDDGIIEIDTYEFEKDRLSLDHNRVLELSKVVLNLEKEYKNIFNSNIGIDIEWALDGIDNKLYIIQTAPETVHSNLDKNEIEKFFLHEKSKVLLEGVPGDKISSGRIVKMVNLDEYKKFTPGDIILTDMTTPTINEKVIRYYNE